MDPVNKWLLVIVLFMVSLLFAIWYSSGVGRYEMLAAPSTMIGEHYVIFVLDTKDGDVYGKLVDEDAMLNGAGKVRTSSTELFELPAFNGYRRY